MTDEAIYIGRRMLTSGKLAHSFITMAHIIECETQVSARQFLRDYPSEVTELIERKASLFTLKSTPGMIGGVYAAPDIDNGKINARPAWQRSSDLPYIPAWRAADQSAYSDSRKASLEKKSDDDAAFRRAIDTLHNRYQRIMPCDRIGFQVWLINQMVKK